MDLKELEKKINDNEERIANNEKKIDDHLEKIQKNSYALDILKDYKADNKRLYTILMIVLIMWVLTLACLILGKLL